MEVIKEICDCVAVIEDGRLIRQGSTVDVFTKPKMATTREFVRFRSRQRPAGSAESPERAARTAGAPDILLRLSFIGDVTDEPLLSTLIRKFDIEVSILYANVDDIQNTSFGRLIVLLNGGDNGLQDALRWLESCPIESEVIGYVPELINLLWQSLLETLYMVVISSTLAALFGIPLGVLLLVTDKGHILENAVINKPLGIVVNMLRSIPFIILMVAIIPLTRIIAGTSIGTTAACVPLTDYCGSLYPHALWKRR